MLSLTRLKVWCTLKIHMYLHEHSSDLNSYTPKIFLLLRVTSELFDGAFHNLSFTYLFFPLILLHQTYTFSGQMNLNFFTSANPFCSWSTMFISLVPLLSLRDASSCQTSAFQSLAQMLTKSHTLSSQNVLAF
jgi:hypothetical protein